MWTLYCKVCPTTFKMLVMGGIVEQNTLASFIRIWRIISMTCFSEFRNDFECYSFIYNIWLIQMLQQTCKLCSINNEHNNREQVHDTYPKVSRAQLSYMVYNSVLNLVVWMLFINKLTWGRRDISLLWHSRKPTRPQWGPYQLLIQFIISVFAYISECCITFGWWPFLNHLKVFKGGFSDDTYSSVVPLFIIPKTSDSLDVAAKPLIRSRSLPNLWFGRGRRQTSDSFEVRSQWKVFAERLKYTGWTPKVYWLNANSLLAERQKYTGLAPKVYWLNAKSILAERQKYTGWAPKVYWLNA
jgi:hypothetical protein